MKVLIFIFCLFLSFPVLSQESADQDIKEEKIKNGVVRGFIWGLPPTVILENEKGTFLGEEEGALFYLDYLRGMKSTIAYDFLDNKLWKARIFVEKKYVDPQDYIRDIMTIRKDLVARYGEPVQEEMEWRENKDKNFPDAWGWAVYRGKLFMTLYFQDAETDVIVYLGAKEEFDPDLNVTYVERKTNEMLRNKQKQGLMKAP